MSLLIYEDVDGLKFIDELEQIFPEHYDELCVTKDFALEPDYDAYRRMAAAGMLRTITCRVDEELIGYIVFIIQPHLHYKSCKTAFEDIYYVKKEYRKGRIGIKLFKYAESVLKEIGVNRIIMHTKIHLDNSRLFEYLGYKHTDKLYTKLL
jgi:GNAT superfamily N-acetyltransferase